MMLIQGMTSLQQQRKSPLWFFIALFLLALTALCEGSVSSTVEKNTNAAAAATSADVIIEEHQQIMMDTTTTTKKKSNVTTAKNMANMMMTKNHTTTSSSSSTTTSTTASPTNDENDDETEEVVDIDDESFMIPVPDPSIVGYPVSTNILLDRRSVDIVNTVRPEHTNQNNGNPLGVSEYEWKARTELAAAYRALHLLGVETSSVMGSDQAAQCLMLRLQEEENEESDNNDSSNNEPITFLMADWGVWFEEVTASNLLKFTTDGYLVKTTKNGTSIYEPIHPVTANIGCIPVANAIYTSRPDVNMIVHIHPYSVMAVGGTKYGLLPLSQASFFLWGQISREEYDFTYESNFEETLANGFKDGQRAMLLNHHGMYAVGRDVAEGIFVASHVTQACEVQVRTLSMVGGNLNKVRCIEVCCCSRFLGIKLEDIKKFVCELTHPSSSPTNVSSTQPIHAGSITIE